jgi:hypothetical protein
MGVYNLLNISTNLYLSQSQLLEMDPHVKGALLGGISTASALTIGYFIRKSISANNVTSLAKEETKSSHHHLHHQGGIHRETVVDKDA